MLTGWGDALFELTDARLCCPGPLTRRNALPNPRICLRTAEVRTESALARLIRPHYSRGQDEARALMREAFTLPGDLEITGSTLHVRLDPASAPRRSRALAALCAELTDTQTRYPGTDLTLAYSIKGHPTTA